MIPYTKVQAERLGEIVVVAKMMILDNPSAGQKIAEAAFEFVRAMGWRPPGECTEQEERAAQALVTAQHDLNVVRHRMRGLEHALACIKGILTRWPSVGDEELVREIERCIEDAL